MLLEKWLPDVTELKPDVLLYCVVAVDFDGLPNSSGEPVFDGGDDLRRVPVDDVV